MKSKKAVFFTVIVSFIVLSTVIIGFNDGTTQNNNFATNNLAIDDSEILERLGLSNNAINDHITTAEDAAQWLRTEWMDNNFNRSGAFNLGQNGISGVGDFFVELYKVTEDTTYRTWASDIADWLIYQHTTLGYPAGKWPNKLAVSDVSNYSSYEQGVAGIGSFFINVYNVTLNATYKYEASKIHEYLDFIDVTAGTGLVWEEKEALTHTDGKGTVSYNTINNGTGVGPLSNLNIYDGSYYQINSDGDITDVDYSFSLLQLIPFNDFSAIDEYMSKLTVEITVKSSAILDSGDVRIYNDGNSSWVDLDSSATITQAEQEHSKVMLNEFSNWTFGGSGLIRINVNSSDNGAHNIQIDELNITIDYDNGFNSTSYSTGAAGIGEFYLNMLENDLGNVTLENKAKGAGNYILDERIETSQGASWFEKGEYYTTIDKGAAGIGKFLLRLGQDTGDATYGPYALKAGDWLINNNATVSSLVIQNTSLLWAEYNETTSGISDIHPGMGYSAGIAQFLLELGQDIGGYNGYIINATYAANWLMNTQYMVATEDLFNEEVYCKWKSKGFASYTYSIGTAGALEFLNNIFMELGYTPYSNFLSKGMEWIIKTINITTDEWDGDNSTYNIGEGLAGVGLGLINIDIKKAGITADSVPAQLEFDETARVEFSIVPYGSTINENNTYIMYAYGTDYLSGIWTRDTLTYISGDDYFFEFPALVYNNTWHYAIMVVDSNNTISFDNNGNEYQMYITDTKAPITRLVPQYGVGIGAGESGILEIRVKKNDTRGAPFDHVTVEIPGYVAAFDIHDNDVNWDWDSVNQEFVYLLQITVESGLSYGTTITVNVYTYDTASNMEIDQDFFIISDNFVPTLSEPPQAPASRWVPQYSGVAVEAKVEDVGAGLDNNTGVFVKYTTDDGATWQTAFLKKDETGSKWVGTIPGQFLLVKVYYVYGAKDKSGNEVYWDIFHSISGLSYNSPLEIMQTSGLDAMYSYTITINWTMLLIIVGVIAIIVVTSYLVYSKRGGYLERMRRKSKATATGLAIKEKITNFYYKIYDRMNKIGDKMAKGMSGGGGKIRLWFGDHFGDKPKKFLTAIGRILWAVPKGIFNGIRNGFKGLGRLITNSKAWHLIFFMGLGFTMLITTILQFLMAAGYPLRAVFFANMGFLMLISGIVAFLLRFIYKLSYK